MTSSNQFYVFVRQNMNLISYFRQFYYRIYNRDLLSSEIMKVDMSTYLDYGDISRTLQNDE